MANSSILQPAVVPFLHRDDADVERESSMKLHDEKYFITDATTESSHVKNLTEWKDSTAYDSEGKIILSSQWAQRDLSKKVESFLDSPHVSPALKSTGPLLSANPLVPRAVIVTSGKPPKNKVKHSLIMKIVLITAVVVVVIAMGIGLFFIGMKFSEKQAGCLYDDIKRCVKGGANCVRDEAGNARCVCFESNDSIPHWNGSMCVTKSPNRHHSSVTGTTPRTRTAPVTTDRIPTSADVAIRRSAVDKGVNSAQDAAWEVTCDDLLQAMCAKSPSAWDICNSEATAQRIDEVAEFVCQLVHTEEDPGDTLRRLLLDESSRCETSVSCHLLREYHPCFIAYLNNGTLQCASDETCISNVPSSGIVLPFYGYCIHKTDACEGAMQNLSEVVGRSTIGFAYDKNIFNSDSLFEESMSTSAHLRPLFYPLMLAYETSRFSESFAEIRGDIGPVDSLMETYAEKLRTLYTDHPGFNIKTSPLHPTSHSRVNHLAQRIMRSVVDYECIELWDCPPQGKADEVVRLWLKSMGGHCALASALYAKSLNVDVESYGMIARKRGANFSTDTVNLLHTSAFIRRLLKKVDHILARRRLTSEEFNRSEELCHEIDSLNMGERSIVLSIVLYEQLWLQNGYQAGLDEVSKFALILVNDPSVQRAVCDISEQIPTVDCELRLYHAFAAFLPAVSDAEAQLVGSNDRAVVYFVLRAAARSLVYAETVQMAPIRRSDQSVYRDDILKASQVVSDKCLGQILD